MNFVRLFIVSLLFLSGAFSTALSQTIKVIDETTLQPVENVYIFNKEENKTVISNKRGEADISKFNPNDYLIFQHPSFKRRTLSYSEVKKAD